jgi:hypothetical protein
MPLSQNKPAVTEALKYGECDITGPAEPIGDRQCGNERGIEESLVLERVVRGRRAVQPSCRNCGLLGERYGRNQCEVDDGLFAHPDDERADLATENREGPRAQGATPLCLPAPTR